MPRTNRYRLRDAEAARFEDRRESSDKSSRV